MQSGPYVIHKTFIMIIIINSYRRIHDTRSSYGRMRKRMVS